MQNEATVDIVETPEKPRIHYVDMLRGLCVVLMVFFHAFFSAGFIFEIDLCIKAYDFFRPAEPFFAGLFILISGFSCRLSHSNLIRGVKLAGVALAVTGVTWLFENLLADSMGVTGIVIWFGILHLLSVSMILFALLRPLLDKLPAIAGILICVFLFAVTYKAGTGFIGIGNLGFNVPEIFTENRIFYPVGLHEFAISAGDYFPVVPWIFLFFAGSFAGVYATRNKLPRELYHNRIPFLSWIGRKSLIIYVIHQPLIVAVLYVLSLIKAS